MNDEYLEILSHADDEEWLKKELLYSGWHVKDDAIRGVVTLTKAGASLIETDIVTFLNDKVYIDKVSEECVFDAVDLLLFSLYSRHVQRRYHK